MVAARNEAGGVGQKEAGEGGDFFGRPYAADWMKSGKLA
jgi:hypothetical protein